MGIFSNFRKTPAEDTTKTTAKTTSDKNGFFGKFRIAEDTAKDDKKPKVGFFGNILSDAK